MTTPVTRALREALPDAYLAWVVEPKSREILEGNPYLDEVLTWERPKGSLPLRSLAGARRLLAPRRFDWAIDCQGNLRSALVARLSGARRVVGNSRAKEGADRLYHVRVPRREDDLSSRQRCLDLLRPLGVESADRRMVIGLSESDRRAARAALEAEGIQPGTPYACLVPATTWAQKHWFEEQWAALAGLLRERLGLAPVVLGGPADVPLAERLREQAPGGCAVAAGKTSLKGSVALLEGARLTVAVDTFLMHASVAVETPTVGVCGASWWPGFQDYAPFALVREPLSCSPCLHRPSCAGRFDCMRALDAERVLAAAAGLIGGT